MILRDYQTEGNNLVMTAWKDAQSTLIVVPTGCGKTIMFADLIRRMQPQRCMVIAHRAELIWQARDKIERHTGLRCDIEMADLEAGQGGHLFDDAQLSPVVVSTVQTQNSGCNGDGRMTKFNPMEFGLLIIDEAHHAVSDSYQELLNHYKQNPDIRILGVTATPDRADEEALGKVFESVAFDYEILDAIHNGWLVPVDQQMVHVSGLDFSAVRTTAGDLNGADLAAIMEAEETCQRIAAASIEIIGAKRAIVFTASVDHAEKISNIFNRHRDGMAGWVCGKTDDEQRKNILRDFAAGKIQVVANCGVLTEGFDDSGVEVIIMGRPTKSRSLYAQMVGRSTRPLPGVVDGPQTAEGRKSAIASSSKKSCLVVDFVGNSGKHKLVTSADILGGNVSDEAIERAERRAKSESTSVRMSQLLDEEEAKIAEERENRRREEEARKMKLVGKAKFSQQKIDAFGTLDLQPSVERAWDKGKSLSEKQMDFLRRSGIEPSTLVFGQAKFLIGEIIRRRNEGLASFKQIKCLKKNRIQVDSKTLTFKEASAKIEVLSQKWKNPHPKPKEPYNPVPA